ncbi:hypothetical protein [Kribbella sp. NPDC055071]
MGLLPGVHRMLYCYSHERLVGKLRDLVEVQEAAHRLAMEREYELGPLFVEEDASGRAMQALIEAATSHIGGAVVAMPHRGHLIPLGGPLEWQAFLEETTGHSLLFTGHNP